MDYYFDESGDWQVAGSESNCLLIGGLLFKNNDLERRLGQEWRIFKADEQLQKIHATDLTTRRRGLCYQILNQHLTDETRVLLQCFPPEILNSKTRLDTDEIYLQCAARLVQLMALGDAEIRVHYDMKFYYAYPMNVINNIGNIHQYLKIAKQRFILDPGLVRKERDKLLKRLENSKSYNAYERRKLEGFRTKLATQIDRDIVDPFDTQLVQEMGRERKMVSQQVSNYLWSELWQQFEGEDRMREKFRAQILANINQAESQLEMAPVHPSLGVDFVGKQQDSAGIIAIDLICNLVYRHVHEPATSLIDAEEEILQKIVLLECGV